MFASRRAQPPHGFTRHLHAPQATHTQKCPHSSLARMPHPHLTPQATHARAERHRRAPPDTKRPPLRASPPQKESVVVRPTMHACSCFASRGAAPHPHTRWATKPRIDVTHQSSSCSCACSSSRSCSPCSSALRYASIHWSSGISVRISAPGSISAPGP